MALRSCRRSAQLAWRRLDLPCCQLKVLIVLAHEGFISVGSLGARMGLSRPRASKVVSQLVQRGLVTRTDDSADRRRTHVHLTAEGASLLEDLFPTGQRALPTLVGHLTDPDLMGLARGLRALAQELERSLAQPVSR
jgi:DNA-binding MarR family transcriptional regulator